MSVEPAAGYAAGMGGAPLNLAERLRCVAAEHATRPALTVGAADYTYAELAAAVTAVRAAVPGSGPRQVAILASRDISYYAAVFAAVSLGWSYVPLNATWPAERLAQCLEKAKPDALLVDAPGGAILSGVVPAHGLACPAFQLDYESRAWQVDQVAGPAQTVPTLRDGSIMYVMFTSGSTGAPKGVPVTFANVEAYLAGLSALTAFGPDDVFLQAVELTFDLSVHDMMLCWSHGARLVSVPAGASGFAPRFITQAGVTSALLVPSAAAQAKAHGLLGRRPMTTLRTSFFCGEALPGSLAASWAAAAPNAEVWNIYGPTEATIAFSALRFDPVRDGARDVVGLGVPLGDGRFALSDAGEIMLSGAQLTPGYLDDPAMTAARFPEVGGERWYLTGDRGAWDAEQGLVYRGRLDDQIKLRGYRVELGEIEAKLRAAAGVELVAALAGEPSGPSAYNTLIGVVCGAVEDPPAVLDALRRTLPAYMVPSALHRVDAMPQNSNGKVDRKELHRRWAAGELGEGVRV